MRINRSIRVGIGVMALAVVASACGGGEEKSASQSASEGKLTVGIKYDQPGLGLRNPDGSFSGFDVEVAEYVAGKLGVAPENIEFKESPSAQRETLIQNGEVDYIVATYSITDARKEKVDFAGPYFIAGQSLLVKSDNTDITGPDSLNGGKKLCSVTGSTPRRRSRTRTRRTCSCRNSTRTRRASRHCVTVRWTPSPPTTSSSPATRRSTQAS